MTPTDLESDNAELREENAILRADNIRLARACELALSPVTRWEIDCAGRWVPFRHDSQMMAAEYAHLPGAIRLGDGIPER
jgi:hypothetical protein